MAVVDKCPGDQQVQEHGEAVRQTGGDARKEGHGEARGEGAARNSECYGEQNMCCGLPHWASLQKKLTE